MSVFAFDPPPWLLMNVTAWRPQRTFGHFVVVVTIRRTTCAADKCPTLIRRTSLGKSRIPTESDIWIVFFPLDLNTVQSRRWKGLNGPKSYQWKNPQLSAENIQLTRKGLEEVFPCISAFLALDKFEKYIFWLASLGESGWHEDCWGGQMSLPNELFSHRNNFHGKIPQGIVRIPIQANIWCSFCRRVSSSSMGAKNLPFSAIFAPEQVKAYMALLTKTQTFWHSSRILKEILNQTCQNKTNSILNVIFLTDIS